MIETSQELIDAMRAEQTVSTRISIINKRVPTLKFFASDAESLLIDNDYIKEIEGDISYNIPQIQNLVTNETGNYAIFEGEGIKLDGTNQVGSQVAKNNQFGWYSKQYCNDICEFEKDCYLSWLHQCYSTSDLNIVFSKVRNEYAVDFDVEVSILLDEADIENPFIPKEEIINYKIRNNTKTTYTLKNIPYGNYNNIISTMVTITILKWSNPISRAKIIDMYYGEMLEFGDDKIVSLNSVKGLDLLNQSTESKTLDLVLLDENEEYNIFSPKGKLTNLNRGASLCLELGCLINDFYYFVKIDEFIIDKPKKEQNTLEVSITGYGILKYLNDSDFTANFYEKIPAQAVFDSLYGYETELIIKVDDEIINENEGIRTELGTVSIPDGINKIATAIRGNVLETVNNKIIIKRIKDSYSVAKIGIENMLSSPEIEKEERPKSIIINKYAPTIKGVETVYSNTLTLLTDDYNIFKYNKEHTAPPYKITRTLVNDEFNIGAVNITEGSILLEDRALLIPAVDWESKIEITANVVEITKTSSKYILDSNNTKEETIDSESIEGQEEASKVFKWLKSNYNKQFKYKVEIQDTFTYELGDSVWLETNVYVDGNMVVRKAIITNIEYSYNGALHYNLTLKGA